VGNITDTSGVTLPSATVLLLDLDSTMVDFTQTDLIGSFQISKIPYGKYLLKVTYVGYIPFNTEINVDQKEIKVPNIKLKEISTELMEVVVKAARAPLKMRGDTMEFDITQFKVPQNSTLEDLLKRLPGMEVEQGGGIKVDGKDVTSVKVEGKTFFGNNPTVATKNLPAEGVSSVQVYDKKSDVAVATGNTTPAAEKEMNVLLKDDFKNIFFGKGTVGGGNIDRMEGKLSFNKFTPLHQLSFIGVGNNTGRNGLGWDDREDFFGAQAYDFGNELKYGFNSVNGMRFFNFNSTDDINLEGKISELFSNSNTGGFPKNVISGLNYNFDNEKIKLGTRYIYNLRGNDRTSFRTVNRFLPNNITNLDSTTSSTITEGQLHRLETTLDAKIDSFNSIRVTLDYNILNSDNNFTSNGLSLRNATSLISTSTIKNIRENSGYLGRGSLVYNKTFRKKGRFLGVNGTLSNSNVDELTNNNSLIDFTSTPDTRLNQDFVNVASKTQIQANAMINEPLNSKFFLSLFYNLDQNKQEGDVDVNDILDNRSTVNTSLTRDFNTTLRYNTAGSTIRFTHSGWNITAGYGYQFTDLYGDFRGLANNSGLVDTSFQDPQLFSSLNYQLSRNGSIGFNYSRTVSVPQISQLSPIVFNANPLYIREGNPSLSPEIVNSISGNLWLSKPLSGIRMSFWSNINVNENAITQEEIVTDNLITTTRPINYKSSVNSNISGNFSIPIVKNKFRASFNGGVNMSASYRLVNKVENKTNTIGFNPSVNMNITPTKDLALNINARYGINNTDYSINKSQNQQIITQSYSSNLSMKLAKSLYFNGTYNHTFFRNDRFGQSTNIPIINGSIYKQFLSNNKGELRLSIYDLLNRNQNFNLNAGTNVVSQSNTLALARYFMLTFSYNIKGLKTGVNDGQNWY
jgi:hypothetical protein